MVLDFKGQGHSGPRSSGSYTVMRPIRRLPQGGIQSLSPSPSISPKSHQEQKPHFVLKRSLIFTETLKRKRKKNMPPAQINLLFSHSGRCFRFAMSCLLSSDSPAVLCTPSSPPSVSQTVSISFQPPCVSLRSSLPSAQCPE